MKTTTSLYSKYDIPGPRYTSYPAHPHWKGAPDAHIWLLDVKEHVTAENNFDLYIHIPFCESLCTYCGCSRVITKNQDLASLYVDALIKEWEMYKNNFPLIKIKSIHLGGGTPTFLDMKNLKKLLDMILKDQDTK